MTILRCRWCPRAATGTVQAPGLGRPAPHCDHHWDSAYQLVRGGTQRTWKIVEKGEPDLLDFLTESEGSA